MAVSFRGYDHAEERAPELTPQADRAAPAPPPGRDAHRMPKYLPPGGPTVPPILDRSASHRSPPTQTAQAPRLDRANTTRAPARPPQQPQGLAMAKSQSGSSRQRHDGPPAGTAPIQRSHTQGKQQAAAQQQGAPRRRDKNKENEDVVRQLQSICSPGDPNGVYRNLHKIGQG